MKSAKRAIATDGMKQITRNEDVALEFIVRGFCPTTIQTKPDLIPYFTRIKKWTWWEWNPRPQLIITFLSAAVPVI